MRLLVPFLISTVLLSGCASYLDTKHSGTSRTYTAWQGSKLGTKKTFRGTIRYGGKDFPVEIEQRLSGLTPSHAILDVSYRVAGLPAGNEKAYISAKGYGPLGMEAALTMLKLDVPPAQPGPHTVVSGSIVSGQKEFLSYVPRQRSFSVSGKTVVADLYTYTNVINGITMTKINGWFSPEIPGGWIALEKPFVAFEETYAQSHRKLFESGQFTSKNIFQINQRASLRLISVE